MDLLKEKIIKEGKYLGNGVLKVDNFLNHQIDVDILNEMGKEWYRIFRNENINKILTVEASGIGVACITAQYFKGAKVVFAKKSKSSNIGNDFYSAKAFSFTHRNTNELIVSKSYLSEEDRVLIVDDFLASGEAFDALVSICEQAGATVVAVGAAIEKKDQGGAERMKKRGIRVESLAVIEKMDDDGTITFSD